jgi:hypothetical protein
VIGAALVGVIIVVGLAVVDRRARAGAAAA